MPPHGTKWKVANNPSPLILMLRAYIKVSEKLFEVLNQGLDESAFTTIAALLKRRTQLIHVHENAKKGGASPTLSETNAYRALLLQIQALDDRIAPCLEDHRAKVLQNLTQLREEKERLESIRKTLPHQAEQSGYYLPDKKA